jgi:hypothetical protein
MAFQRHAHRPPLGVEEPGSHIHRPSELAARLLVQGSRRICPVRDAHRRIASAIEIDRDSGSFSLSSAVASGLPGAADGLSQMVEKSPL